MSREVETADFAAMCRRMVRALGRRVGEGDPHDLAELQRLRVEIDDALRQAVREQRGRSSWGEIAAGLGVTRQTAWSRFAGEDANPLPGGDVERAG